MRLRNDLDHLPDLQRRELELAVRILFESFEAAIGERATQTYKRQAAILKVVLFGSFARGGWVEDRVSGYMSDYDLLVVVNDERLTDQHDYWDGAVDRFVRELTVTHGLRRPVNFIVHSLQDVNAQLERGRPFFLDIVRDGIALYEASGDPLASPKVLPPDETRRESEGYFVEWFVSSGRYLETAIEQAAKGWSKLAAFNLHQTTERLYHCVLLTLTLYSPKSHKLDVLRSLAEGLDPRLRAAWPRENREARRGFDRIRRAYIEARYSPHYAITTDELTYVIARAAHLQVLVEQVCQERFRCSEP